MCPTRELVAQNLSVVRKMAKFSGITSTSTAEEGEDTAGARGRKLIEQVGSGGCRGRSGEEGQQSFAFTQKFLRLAAGQIAFNQQFGTQLQLKSPLPV